MKKFVDTEKKNAESKTYRFIKVFAFLSLRKLFLGKAKPQTLTHFLHEKNATEKKNRQNFFMA